MRMMLNGGKAAALLVALAGCVSPEAGCSAYALQRPDMPPLGQDQVSEWVAVTDSAMTRACRG